MQGITIHQLGIINFVIFQQQWLVNFNSIQSFDFCLFECFSNAILKDNGAEVYSIEAAFCGPNLQGFWKTVSELKNLKQK